MKPIELLDTARTPDGTEMRLCRRDGVYAILCDGIELMASAAHGSEEALARLGCAALSGVPAPRILVGGLGMGYTLRAALDLLPRGARVEVAELVPEVVRWNRGPLGPLAGKPLDDRRVRVLESDVARVIAAPGPPWDAILLDIDNGPEALSLRRNDQLYGDRGLARMHARLVPGGTLAVWSAGPDQRFQRLLRAAGFDASSTTVASREGGKGPRRTIFVGRVRPAARPSSPRAPRR